MAVSLKEFKVLKQSEVAMAEAITRLRKNRDFKRVIAEGFFKDEAVRCVAVKAQYAMRSDESQRLLDNRLTGIGELNTFLQTMEAIGNLAVADLANADKETEGLDEDECMVEEVEE